MSLNIGKHHNLTRGPIKWLHRKFNAQDVGKLILDGTTMEGGGSIWANSNNTISNIVRN